MSTSIPQIGITGTALSLLPIAVAAVFYGRWCGQGGLVAYASMRMVLQLLAIGLVLVYLFENPDWRMGALVLGVIISASSWIGMRTVRRTRRQQYGIFFGALALSGIPILALDLLIVQEGTFRYVPRLFIPLAGMVFSNAMNTLSLAAERFETEFARSEDFAGARGAAFHAAMIPQVNSFLSVGMVSLPGMMTGQILAGTSPLVAVRYQILIMAMVLGCAGLSMALYFWFLRRRLEVLEKTPKVG